jgi:hypothetical protein
MTGRWPVKSPPEDGMNHKTLRQIHEEKTGKVSDKWESYFDFYDPAFLPFAQREVALLEIGIQNGGSLETYAEYFQNVRTIVGCDINPRCAQLVYDDPRVQVVVGDANADATHQRILQIAPQFDIIIDDGSHVSVDILNAFIRYFPHLAPGGLFVVEDSHTLYSKVYGGGLLNEFSATHFFKKLVDVVNHEWWQPELSLENYLSTFFLTGVPAFLLEGWVESIEFRNSIIAIRKAKKPGHQKLGERLIRGSRADVVELVGKVSARPI